MPPGPHNQNSNASIRVIFALTLVHFTGDLYNSFISPLFPLFIEKHHLSLTQVGVIAGVSRFCAFVVQPSAGYLADRFQNRVFILGGLMLAVIFIPLAGIAVSFWMLLFFIVIGSIGTAMFHPSATGMLPLYAGRNPGLSMAVFNTGGTLSYAVGPLLITWYASVYGLAAVPLTMVFGFASFLFLFPTLPSPQSEGLGNRGFFAVIRETLSPAWKPIALVWTVMTLRAVVGQSFMTFIPVLYVNQGYSLVSAGLIFSLFTLAGTFSGIAAGYLSDRIGFKIIFFTTHALMTPILLLMLYLPGHWIYLTASLAGFFCLATLPLGVVMAQTLAPRGKALAASLMMGLALGIGSVITPIVGKLADMFTLEQVLCGVSMLPLLTLLLILRFPEVKPEP